MVQDSTEVKRSRVQSMLWPKKRANFCPKVAKKEKTGWVGGEREMRVFYEGLPAAYPLRSCNNHSQFLLYVSRKVKNFQLYALCVFCLVPNWPDLLRRSMSHLQGFLFNSQIGKSSTTNFEVNVFVNMLVWNKLW